ncbi:hypothetical protein TKK_0008066 [Trichogramma kaykai]
MILGFAEDYPKIIVNMKHELILTRARTDLNAVLQTQRQVGEARTYEEVKITISKLEWVMPYVQLSNQYKIRLLHQIDKPIAMSFRSWELYEYPTLPISTRHVWTVKTSNQLEKPRFVILGFQTNRKAIRENDASLFDHCNLTNVKLFLNSQYYPYNNLNINVAQSQYAALYDMYVLPLVEEAPTSTYLFNSPIPFQRLSEKYKIENTKLQEIYGIKYDLGTLDQSMISSILCSTLSNAQRIYVNNVCREISMGQDKSKLQQSKKVASQIKVLRDSSGNALNYSSNHQAPAQSTNLEKSRHRSWGSGLWNPGPSLVKKTDKKSGDW